MAESTVTTPPTTIGKDTDDVLTSAGFSAEEIAALTAAGTV
jgi:crotonobetainyl-CoA:carnitine CoA-transferase CaiB-like acyl-CoA transferase